MGQQLHPQIGYEEAFLYYLRTNGLNTSTTIPDNSVNQYIDYYGHASKERLDEFTRKAYFDKMKTELLNRVNYVDFNKVFEATVSDYGVLSEYDFNEKCFHVDIKYHDAWYKLTRNILATSIGGAASSQDLEMDNYKCFDFSNLYISPDSAKVLVDLMAQHGNTQRNIALICTYNIVNRLAAGTYHLNLIANIHSIKLFEACKRDNRNYRQVNNIFPNVYIAQWNRSWNEYWYYTELKMFYPNCN